MILPFPVYQVPIVLASKSPRREELMRQVGFRFIVQVAGETDEQYPQELQREEIPLFLARLKADAFLQSFTIPDDTIVVTADTIVWLNGRVLGKPVDRTDAVEMLEALSDKMHHVYTGVCLTTNQNQRAFFDESNTPSIFVRTLRRQKSIFSKH